MPAVAERKVDLPHPALSGADWADCWQTVAARPFADARAAAEAIIAAFPVWTAPALLLRNILVAPFLLKRRASRQGDRVGFFPVLSQTDEQLIAGLDDRHLDFRIVVEIGDADAGQRLGLTTLIRRHNAFGRVYLALVLPFHRAIIRTALARAVR